MKRVLTFVLVLAMVLGSFSPAWAAPSDVAGTKYRDAVTRLEGLGVIAGYPDGSFRPENTITRAEFAVVAVKLLGLADAAVYARGQTGFSDVPAGHWASGYVNIAVNRGIIMGYPDGTFMPEREVSYTEALTMLVRVLGYGPAADEEGTWPSNYISKAAELGVTGGISFYGYSPAKRGDIALMADNALDIPMMVRVGYGDEATYEVRKDQTLLSSRIKSGTVEAVLLGTWLTDRGLDEDEISVLLWDDKEDEYDILEEFDIAENADIDFNLYLGEEVTLWLNDDDEVFMLERETDERDIVQGVIDDIDVWEIVIVDDGGDDEEYEFADDLKIYINLQDEDYEPEDLERGMYIKALTDRRGDVYTIVATRWSIGIIDEVDVKREEIEWKHYDSDRDFEDNYGDLDLEDMYYDIDLDDLEEDMVVYWYSVPVDRKHEEYRFFFEIYDGKKAGELEEYKEDDYIVVDGREYKLAYNLIGDYVTYEDITDLLGDDVEAYLGKEGRAVMLELDEARSRTRDYALVADIALHEDKYGNPTPYIKLLTAGGEIVEYEIAEDALIRYDRDGDGKYKGLNELVDRDVDDYVYDGVENQLTFGSVGNDRITVVENVKEFNVGHSNIDQNTLVKYSLDRDGCVDELEVVGQELYASSGTRVDKDNGRIGKGLFVERDTVIFDAYNEEVITFSKLTDGMEYDIKFVDDDADLEVLVVYGDEYVEDTEYAIYLSKSHIADGEYKVRVIIDDEKIDINTDMGNDAKVFDGAQKGEVFSIDLADGMIIEAEPVSELTPHADYITARVDDMNVSRNRIGLDGNGYFLFGDDVRVYEYELDENDGTVEEVELARIRDIDEDQLVNVVLDEDGYIVYVYIIDDDVFEEPDVIEEILFELW